MTNQLVAVAAHRHRSFLHRFQQRGLGLGGGAIDLVGEHQVGEQWSLLETELPVAVVLFDDLRAGDVRRHQVWRELDAREGQPHAAGQ